MAEYIYKIYMYVDIEAEDEDEAIELLCQMVEDEGYEAFETELIGVRE